MEGIIKHYYDKLEEESNPGLMLAKFYGELFSISLSQGLIISFNKLVKLYGRKIVFSALLEIADNDNLDHSRIHGLIAYICKKRLEENAPTSSSLNGLVEEATDRIKKAKKRKLIIRSPFDDKQPS